MHPGFTNLNAVFGKDRHKRAVNIADTYLKQIKRNLK